MPLSRPQQQGLFLYHTILISRFFLSFILLNFIDLTRPQNRPQTYDTGFKTLKRRFFYTSFSDHYRYFDNFPSKIVRRSTKATQESLVGRTGGLHRTGYQFRVTRVLHFPTISAGSTGQLVRAEQCKYAVSRLRKVCLSPRRCYRLVYLFITQGLH